MLDSFRALATFALSRLQRAHYSPPLPPLDVTFISSSVVGGTHYCYLGPPGFVKPPLLGLNPDNPYTFSNLFLWLLGVSARRTPVMLFHHPAFVDCSLVTPSSGQLRAKRPKTNQTKTSIPPPTNNHPNLKVDRKSYSYRDLSHCGPPPPTGACKVLSCFLSCSLPSLSTLPIDFC